MDFNPYHPPKFIEPAADDEFTDLGIVIPTWDRVIANAAFVSSLLGLAMFAGFLTQGIGLIALLILIPLGFSWHFCRTYRLFYRNVPKFGWLPWAFVFVTFLLTIFATLLLRVLMGVTFLASEIYLSQVLPFATSSALIGAIIAGVLSFAMDVSLTLYMSRQSNPKKTLLTPLLVALVMFLLWLPVAHIWKISTGIPPARIGREPLLMEFMFGCAFTLAVFYALIMAHPTVRDRMLFARTDPRQFTKREFRL